jgi:hypothetical protein
MPFLQLRDMVAELVEDTDAVREFEEVQPTTYRPPRRLSTIDALIETLPKY